MDLDFYFMIYVYNIVEKGKDWSRKRANKNEKKKLKYK